MLTQTQENYASRLLQGLKYGRERAIGELSASRYPIANYWHKPCRISNYTSNRTHTTILHLETKLRVSSKQQ